MPASDLSRRNVSTLFLSAKCVAIGAALLISGTSQADDVTWNGSASTDWLTGTNWSNNAGPVQGDAAIVNSGTPIFSSGTTPGYNAIRQYGGTVTFSGGTFNCANASSWESRLDGTLVHTGTEATINSLEIGRSTGATGIYTLSGGSLKISRGHGGTSLFLGTNRSSGAAGTGTLEILGGTFTTRTGVKLGDGSSAGTGNFTVLGSAIEDIGIGGANTDSDGTWEQNAGSTIKVGIDYGGVASIFLKDGTATTGTSATFASGSILDVGYYKGFTGGGTWTVMEVENGDIMDGGLAFAPGVDISTWSFTIDNTGTNGVLTVTSSAAVIRDVYWDGDEDTLWENPLNWTNDFGVFDGSYVHIDSGTVDYSTASEATPAINLRGFRMTDGTLNLSSGELKATDLASAYSQMDGAVYQTGGSFDVNTLELGREVPSTASYHLSAGELKISRGRNGYSLYLGTNSSSSNSGSGTLTISGGKFTTRSGVKLGDATDSGTGKFVVLGSAVTEIGIAGANTDGDGTWEQYGGSTLQIGIDFGGVTPIYLKDGTSTSGTSATFASGALLDVDYYGISSGGGTWTVMEVENGLIVDGGLAFAPGVDTNIWSFAIDNSGSNGRLTVTAIGNPLGHALTIGNTPQQKMRYGMDYERLWYWTGGLNGSERDQIARWSVVDADVDFVRVAVNSAYELTEGSYDLNGYTNKIIPLMQEMQQANPNIKFFASPRPLDEAVSGASWQPYPLWVTGATTSTSGDYDFQWQKCAEYLVRYLLLMKSYGFKISSLNITNEWQSNVGGGRVTQDDMNNIHNIWQRISHNFENRINRTTVEIFHIKVVIN